MSVDVPSVVRSILYLAYSYTFALGIFLFRSMVFLGNTRVIRLYTTDEYSRPFVNQISHTLIDHCGIDLRAPVARSPPGDAA